MMSEYLKTMYHAKIEGKIESNFNWIDSKGNLHKELPITAEEWEEFIPQTEASKNLFNAYLEIGYTPNVAALKVLERALRSIDRL